MFHQLTYYQKHQFYTKDLNIQTIFNIIMDTVAINSMPIKVPIICLIILTISLALVNLVGLIRVEMDVPKLRLLIILAAYLLIICAIIILKLKKLKQGKIGLNCSSKADLNKYEPTKKQLTALKLSQLQKSKQYKEWLKQKANKSKSNIVYEVQSQSEDQNVNVTCHQLATMKKLF